MTDFHAKPQLNRNQEEIIWEKSKVPYLLHLVYRAHEKRPLDDH